jgi:endonuclease/exonuclease/phosphatase family metal-dependent hydrolase
MKLPGRARLGIATILALMMVVAVPGTVAAAENSHGHDKRQLTVMTQNLYLGSSLNPAIDAMSATDFITAVAQIYGTAVFTNFPQRAEAIADTIADEEPDLIALQEVSNWIAQPPEDCPPEDCPRSFDFLDILTDELEERGLDYRVAAVSENASIGPVPLVIPNSPCTTVEPAPSCVVTLQDRDVILVNADTPGLKVLNSRTGDYAAQVVPDVPIGAPASFARGWAYVDGRFKGKKFRFVNTHLEVARFAATQEAQAQEFLAGPARAAGAVIAAGDFNSAADPAQVSTTTYEELTAEWFKDAWLRVNPDDPGPTCCQSETLSNIDSLLRTRIDLILTHGPVRAKAAAVVGDTAIPAVEPPFWASDHAGVVATLRLH